MTVALYAGSFDPIHLGHMAVIERIVSLYDQVVVAVVANPGKSTGLLHPMRRLELVEQATAHLPTVRCVHFSGLSVDLAEEVGATVLVRTGHKERGSERSMAAMNTALSGIPTIFVPVDPELRGVSSSVVRTLVENDRLSDAVKLVPDAVREAIAEAAPHAPS